MDNVIFRAVEEFANLTYGLSDAELEQTWDWKGYTEGVRFSFFRTAEQLRQLAAELEQARFHAGLPITAAQRALVQYHVAFREMQGAVFGVTDAQGDQRPAPEQWPVRFALTHVAESDRAFFAMIDYTVRRARSVDPQSLPEGIPEDEFNTFWAEDDFVQIAEQGPLSRLLGYYAGWHERVISTLASVSDVELELPSLFWEPQPFPVRFRLHRFESHLRQHTIQIEKTLEALGLRKGETRRLLRMVYAALGEAEGMMLGAQEVCIADCEHAAAEITSRTREVAVALAGQEIS